MFSSHPGRREPSKPIGAPSSDGLKVGKAFFHPYDDIEEIKKRLDKLEKTNRKNPRADKYEIEKAISVGRELVLVVKYPNCKNYEGRKILVYKNMSVEKLLQINNNLIDPHFTDNKSFVSPIARFEPTEEGLRYACIFANSIT